MPHSQVLSHILMHLFKSILTGAEPPSLDLGGAAPDLEALIAKRRKPLQTCFSQHAGPRYKCPDSNATSKVIFSHLGTVLRRRMAIELVVDAMELAEDVDQIVLFSGDGSFRSLIEALQRHGVRVTVVSSVIKPADDRRRTASSGRRIHGLAGSEG
jgi:hypothetical protein